mgnify:CR=1 FL=1
MSPENDPHRLDEVNRIALSNFRRIRKFLEKSGLERNDETTKTFKRTNNASSRDPKLLGDLLDDFSIQADLAAPLAVGGLTFRWAEIVGEDMVYVSRIRRDATLPQGLSLWSVGDDVRLGAALNAARLAEAVLKA